MEGRIKLTTYIIPIGPI